MSDQDFLKMTLKNILDQLAEVKIMIENNSRDNSSFKDDIILRVSCAENRITKLETERNIIGKFLDSDLIKRGLYFVAIVFLILVGAKFEQILKVLEFVK